MKDPLPVYCVLFGLFLCLGFSLSLESPAPFVFCLVSIFFGFFVLRSLRKTEILLELQRKQMVEGNVSIMSAGSDKSLNGGTEKKKCKDMISQNMTSEHKSRSRIGRIVHEARDYIRRIFNKTKQESSKPCSKSLRHSREDTEQTPNSGDLNPRRTSEGVADEKLLNPDQARKVSKHHGSSSTPSDSGVQSTVNGGRNVPGPLKREAPAPRMSSSKKTLKVAVNRKVEPTPLPLNKMSLIMKNGKSESAPNLKPPAPRPNEMSPIFVQSSFEPTIDIDQSRNQEDSVKPDSLQKDSASNSISRVMPVDPDSGHLAEEKEASTWVKGPMFFEKLPLEVRIMIYRCILTTSPIKRAAESVEQHTRGLIALDETDPSNILAIDARMLRTCRQMYAETLPILYGDNNFCFTNVGALDTFRKEGLATTLSEKSSYNLTPIFNLEAHHSGRLSMIKKLWLDLGLKSGSTPSRIMIQHEWGRFLHQNQYDSCDPDDYWGFPLLEDLTLDFSSWELKKDEGLIVRPFVDKFRGLHGLRHAVIIGVSHEKSLAQLEKGLLREGGMFQALCT